MKYYPFIYLFYLLIYLSIYFPIYPHIYLSMYVCIHVFIYLFIFIYFIGNTSTSTWKCDMPHTPKPEHCPIRGWTIKFANSPPCACHGSTGQNPLYGFMTLTYQHFTAVLFLIYSSLFLSGIYYCLRVFWCAATRMSELDLEQRTNKC